MINSSKNLPDKRLISKPQNNNFEVEEKPI